MAKSVLSPQDAPATRRKKTTKLHKESELAWCLPGNEDALNITTTGKGQSGQDAFQKFLKEEGFKAD